MRVYSAIWTEGGGGEVPCVVLDVTSPSERMMLPIETARMLARSLTEAADEAEKQTITAPTSGTVQ